MKDKKPVEAEKGEIIIRNSNDDIAIIPKEISNNVNALIENGEFSTVDKIVSDLPSYGYYAEEGLAVPKGDEDKTYAIFQDITGRPWSKAKELGYTDGSVEQNISLRNDLIAGKFNDDYTPEQVVFTPHDVSVKPEKVDINTLSLLTNDYDLELPTYYDKGKLKNNDPDSDAKAIKVSREDYINNISDYYNKVTNNGENPELFKYVASNKLTENGENCIYGVCSLVEEASPETLSKKYTGNQTFRDVFTQEGFEEQLLSEDLIPTLEKGDWLQFGENKGDIAGATYVGDTYIDDDGNEKSWKKGSSEWVASQWTKQIGENPESYNDYIPTHMSIILDKYEKDGETYYVYGNNSGQDEMTANVMTEKQFKQHYKNAIDNLGYSQVRKYRYSPETAEKVSEYEMLNKSYEASFQARKQAVEENYTPLPKESSVADFAKDFYDDYKGIRKDLSVGYARDPKEIDAAFKDVMAIGIQESNLDNEYVTRYHDNEGIESVIEGTLDWAKQFGVDNLGPLGYTAAKSAKAKMTENEMVDLATERGYEVKNHIPNWKRQINVDKLVKEGYSKDEALDKTRKEMGVYVPYAQNTDMVRSKGAFKQKQPSSYWLKRIKKDSPSFKSAASLTFTGKDTRKTQIENAIGLYLENYDRAKKKYPDENDEFYRQVAILAHNSPSAAFNEEYVNYFIKGEDNPYPKDSKSNYITQALKYKDALEFKGF